MNNKNVGRRKPPSVIPALGAVEFKEPDDIAYLIERDLATGSRDALARLNELGINIPDFRGKA